MITLIAAVAENNAIGKNNQLLWHLPDDFQRFKNLTTGHYIIMGRKTFESFPKLLPNREHVVITRNGNYNKTGITVVSSIEEAIKVCPKNEEVFIIGGAEIYSQAIEIADKIDITKIHSSFEADAFFPEFDLNQWEIVSSVYHPIDERHAIDFTFQTYLRK